MKAGRLEGRTTTGYLKKLRNTNENKTVKVTASFTLMEAQREYFNTEWNNVLS